MSASHVHQRLEERCNLKNVDLEELRKEIEEHGEYVTDNNGGEIYKLKFQGKTIYPVLTFDGWFKTVLAENHVREILEGRRKGRER